MNIHSLHHYLTNLSESEEHYRSGYPFSCMSAAYLNQTKFEIQSGSGACPFPYRNQLCLFRYLSSVHRRKTCPSEKRSGTSD